MLKNSLMLLFLVILIFRLPSVDLSQEVENSLQLTIPQIESVRKLMIENAKLLLPTPHAGLLLGMVIGEKNEIPYKYNQTLKNTGIVHVVVVSGQNLTLLAGFILGFAPYFGRKKTTIFSMLLISAYLFLTGFQIPVIRAAIMFFMTSLAKLYGREGDSIRILILTALLMLIINPLWITSISFQLSFLATIGVVIVAPELMKHAKIIPEIVKQDFCVTVAAQLMTAPLIAFYFNQLSVAGLVVNILLLWTIPFIMIFGALTLLLSLVSLDLAAVVILMPKILLNYFTATVALFNKPWASTFIHTFNIPQLVGIYTLIFSGLFFLKKSNKHEESPEDPLSNVVS